MSEVNVEVKLMNGADEKKLARLLETKKKSRLPESTLTDQLNLMIVSVEGHTDNSFKKTLIDNMPALDARYLRKAYQKLVPTVDLTHRFQCSGCQYDGEMEVPFTTDFFWPK